MGKDNVPFSRILRIFACVCAVVLLFLYGLGTYLAWRNDIFYHKRDMAPDRMIKIANYLDAFPTINRLAHLNLPEEIKTDPFSGKPFVLGKLDQGWYLLSVGPNERLDSKVNHGDFVIYDATNGTVSRGDILCTHNLTPRPSRGPLPHNLGRAGVWAKGYGGYVRVNEEVLVEGE